MTNSFSDARKQSRGSTEEVDKAKWLRDIGKPTLDALQRQLSSIGIEANLRKDGSDYYLFYKAAELSSMFSVRTLSNIGKFDHNDTWISDPAKLQEDVGANIGFLERHYGIKLKG